MQVEEIQYKTRTNVVQKANCIGYGLKFHREGMCFLYENGVFSIVGKMGYVLR